jgi:hypothetical protein
VGRGEEIVFAGALANRIRDEGTFMIAKVTPYLIVAFALVSAAMPVNAQDSSSTAANNRGKAPSAYVEPLDAQTLHDVQALYERLIEAEDAKDFTTVREIVWKSPSALFVAKTATAAEGNWAGFWGYEVVVQHIHDISEGAFRIDPEYARVKTVGLTHDVAETYAPVNITVAYAGQTPVPKPFLMIVDWIRTPEGWKMATDIALPIPPPPAQSK